MANESEIEIYAKITNFAGLEQASQRIYQEQVTIRTDKGKIRARMFKKEKNTAWRFEVTTKKKISAPDAATGVKVNDEVNEPVREGVYLQFKSVAPKFERKIRHIFKVEKAYVKAGKLNAELDIQDIFYEVDVFIKKDGQFAEWCKIDIEVDKIKEQLAAAGLTIEEFDITARVSGLPLGLNTIFVNDGSDPKMGELVQTIFQEQFLRDVQDDDEFTAAAPDAGAAIEPSPDAEIIARAE